MNEYTKLKSVLKILDNVMSDDNIKHKGKAIRKRLKELPTLNFEPIRTNAVKMFIDDLTSKIVNTPSEFNATQATPDFLSGMAHRQNEIIDMLKELAGEK